MKLTREQIVGAIDCMVLVEPCAIDVEIEQVVWDSRQANDKCVFLAIEGEKVDANNFIPQVIDADTQMIIATHKLDETVIAQAKKADATIIKVTDYFCAMHELAEFNRSRLSLNVVGVSGSSGKTTTKNMIAQVCSAQFETVATAANQNNELGVPNTVLRADPNTQVLVVEMGMRGLGQIESLCKAVRPTIGVITNIGTAHEELLGSQDNIARAKSELIAALPKGEGVAILNGDDPFTPNICQYAQTSSRNVAVLLYGTDDKCDICAKNIEFSDSGFASFDIVFPDGRTGHVNLTLAGMHNVSNALAAAAVGFAVDMPIEKICNALNRAKGQSMRQEIVESCGVKIINDAYNANPDSMAAALSLLKIMQAQGKKIAVLGDMGELGKNEKQAHFDTGVKAAECGVDLLVCIGELAQEIAAGATKAGMNKTQVIKCRDIASALTALKQEVTSGDVVLVKASRFMELERVVEELVDKC